MPPLRTIWRIASIILVVISVPVFAVWIGYELILAATATTDAQILFHKEIILAIITGASLLYLVFTLAKNWEMASATRDAAEASQQTLQQMRDVRDEETAPYVLVYFDVPYGRREIYLVIKNIGKTPAKNVSMTFNPPLRNTEDFSNPYYPAEHGVKSLAPNQEIRTVFDIQVEYTRAKLPHTYEVVLSYYGGISDKQRSDIQIMDISMFIGSTFADENYARDIAYQTKMITTALRSISDKMHEDNKKKPAIRRNITCKRK